MLFHPYPSYANRESIFYILFELANQNLAIHAAAHYNAISVTKRCDNRFVSQNGKNA